MMEGQGQGQPQQGVSSKQAKNRQLVSCNETFDEQKSPSAVDFSDINELAEEESASKGSEDDCTDYDDPSLPSNRKPSGAEVRRLLTEGDQDDYLMPPPLTTHIKKSTSKAATPKKFTSPVKEKTSPSTSPTKSPPSTLTSQSISTESLSSSQKKLETPLAAMMPSKYEGVNVRELFPEFREGKVLRWSKLFPPGQNSLPDIWKNANRCRRKRKISAEVQAEAEEAGREKRGWGFQYGEDVSSSIMGSDDEVEFLSDALEKRKNDNNGNHNVEGSSIVSPNPSSWRHGPAELWFDMMNAPEDGESFDYGFPTQNAMSQKGDNEDSSSEDEEPNDKEDVVLTGAASFPEESFQMLTQYDWEKDILWDGSDAKYKKLTKDTAAGWVPSGVNRKPAQNFSHRGDKWASTTPGTITIPTHTPSTMQGSRKKTDKGSGSKDHGGGQVDDTWYSILPVETPELVYGRWEDEVIWSVEEAKIPKPKILTLDPNDENIVYFIPDDVDPSAAKGTVAPLKVKIPHRHAKKSKILLNKAGVINVIEEDSPPPSLNNDDKDPYNVSNDEFYFPKFSKQSLLRISASGNIQHSTPVIELRAPFIPTYMNQTKLRAFHRPAMERYTSGSGPLSHPGPHPLVSLTRHIKKKAKQREKERLSKGGGDIFFMRAPDDLTGKDGELILIEYCEEHPPLLSQVGMCSRILNYYKRQPGTDKGPPQLTYGEVVFSHTTPFLGVMQSGSCIQTLESLLYRAPIFQHPIIKSDFLVIRTRQGYFIREIDALFVAGQECPLFEVPDPNSKRANDFVRDFLQVFIYRLIWKSKDNPRRVSMEEIKRAFPMFSESGIRSRLKLCADFKRTGADMNWWVIKPEFRLPTEEEIRSMVSPEQCCAYYSLIAAEQRLKDAGYGEKFLCAPQDDEDDNQNKIYDEVKTAPWNTTRAYIQAMRRKCLLQLTGPADPTGCGEGFSYIRVPNKPQNKKEEQKALQKRIVNGTDADLRRLPLNDAKAWLRKFDVPEEEIKKLSRWEVIDVVRTLSTEKAKAGEKGMIKFSRGNRFSVAEYQEKYKEECQRIFELQNRVLANSEALSTDDDERSDSELSEIEEMGKNIENIIVNKKTHSQVILEKEEQERRELMKMILRESKDSGDKSPRKKQKEEEENQTLSGLVNRPGRVLKIRRTYRTPDGKEYTRTETVKKAAVIDIYMHIRATKEEPFIRQFALLDEQTKQKMQNEKRRIQDQLRRIKRNQEKDTSKPAPRKRNRINLNPDLKSKCGACGQVGHMRTNKACPLYNASPPVTPPSLTVSMLQDDDKVLENKPNLKTKCGACGQVGHMRTNKTCPLYNASLPLPPPPPPLTVSMSQDDDKVLENKPVAEEEELICVEGTKLQLSGKLMNMYREDMKKQSLVLVLKVPKETVQTPVIRGKKRKAASSPHCDYLAKKKKNTNRRRIDPIVVISGIFESILNELRDLPDSAPFHFPVNVRIFPEYTQRVSSPMDLQTIRENIRQKKYQLTSAFLSDVAQILNNSVIFNTSKSHITEYARNMLNLCKRRLKDKADELEKLERLINPLLDDNAQIGLAHILKQCLEKLKSSPEASQFLKPVDRKKVKDYYDVITKPMDLSRMEDKNKENLYKSRQDFLSDVDQIGINSKLYNGIESAYTHTSAKLMNIANEFLAQFNDQLLIFEANIEKSKSNIYKKHGHRTLGDQCRNAEGYESDEEDEDMEVVDVPNEGDYEQSASAASVSGILDEEVELPPAEIPVSQELEEGEYVSEEEDFKEVSSLSGNDDGYMNKSLLFGGGHHNKPDGAETPRNIHDDLEVSDSDE